MVISMEPIIVRPFEPTAFYEIKQHVTEVRRLFDWPGIPYHDADVTDASRKFNRWQWHRPPLLHAIHNSRSFIQKACEIFHVELKPSYVFLSMYGPEGVCPKHTDRPQCQYTIDLQINSDGSWPIYINEKEFRLSDGEAVCYSGTRNEHYRKPMKEAHGLLEIDDKPNAPTKMDLAFFHFVPVDWMGGTN